MQQDIDSHPNVEEAQLIEKHQLGSLLNIYRQKANFIRLLHRLNLIFLLLGLVLLILFILIIFMNLHTSLAAQQQVTSSYYFVIPSFFMCMLLLLVGLFFIRAEMIRAKSACIITCHNGLLMMEKQFKGRKVEAVYWKDIQTIIERGTILKEYVIKCREGKELPLRGLYQDIDNLVEQVGQRMLK